MGMGLPTFSGILFSLWGLAHQVGAAARLGKVLSFELSDFFGVDGDPNGSEPSLVRTCWPGPRWLGRVFTLSFSSLDKLGFDSDRQKSKYRVRLIAFDYCPKALTTSIERSALVHTKPGILKIHI
jgi:hypothetical protein